MENRIKYKCFTRNVFKKNLHHGVAKYISSVLLTNCAAATRTIIVTEELEL